VKASEQSPGWEHTEDTAEVTDRLQKLSPARADRILRRAIELQTHSDYDDAQLDVETLNRVADELGVHRDIVAKALAEELSKPDHTPPGSFWERIFGPKHVTDQTLLTASRPRAEANIADWMTRHEGLQVIRTSHDATVWTKRASPMNSIRQGLKIAQGTGALRSTRVSHRLETVTETQHVVTLQASTAPAYWTGVGIAGLGVLVAAGLFIGLGIGVGLLAGLAAGLGALVVQVGAGIVAARAWIQQIRRGMGRALTGIAHPEVAGQDTVGQAVMDILGQFKRRR
jgi:hypothetical protein